MILKIVLIYFLYICYQTSGHVIVGDDPIVYIYPEQIHLSYSNVPTEMVVTWVTLTNTQSTVVEYGLQSTRLLSLKQFGSQQKFLDGGTEKRILYIHRVTLKDLKPGFSYNYHCGSDGESWSPIFSFTAMPSSSNWSPLIAIIGDMGNINGRSMPSLQQGAQKGLFDAVIHVGDFAYNFDTDNARRGDAYMNSVQSFAAYVPYMTAVGNHEYAYNFSNYKNRFTMPGGDGEGMFYSVNIGPIHLVAFSSEFYYFLELGWRQIKHQYDWLIKDLTEANKPENRKKQPWLITMCHRPMYCSNNNDNEHCATIENLIRVGLPLTHEFAIEELLYKFQVDVHLQAHEHSYERMWPVYDFTVCNGTKGAYVNPRATVHILSGSGGCQEGVDPFVPFPNNYSAFRSDDYGYTLMRADNSTHLHFQQISDNKGGYVIDEFTMIKDAPIPNFDCKKFDDVKNENNIEVKNKFKVADRYKDNSILLK